MTISEIQLPAAAEVMSKIGAASLAGLRPVVVRLVVDRSDRRDAVDVVKCARCRGRPVEWSCKPDIEMFARVSIFELRGKMGARAEVEGEARLNEFLVGVSVITKALVPGQLADYPVKHRVVGSDRPGHIDRTGKTIVIERLPHRAEKGIPAQLEYGRLGPLGLLCNEVNEAAWLDLTVQHRHRTFDQLDVIDANRRRRTVTTG